MKTKQDISEELKKILDPEYEFKDEMGRKMEVSPKGSLGLLAVGYKGIVAVRKKRENQKEG